MIDRPGRRSRVGRERGQRGRLFGRNGRRRVLRLLRLRRVHRDSEYAQSPKYAARHQDYQYLSHGALLHMAIARLGLSPRVRGNHWRMSHVIEDARSIPACAGEPRPLRLPERLTGVYPRVCWGTGGVTAGTGFSWVYPRVCGGTCRGLSTEGWVVGLSPRVRGNPKLKTSMGTRLGSIPACAGEPGTDCADRSCI